MNVYILSELVDERLVYLVNQASILVAVMNTTLVKRDRKQTDETSSDNSTEKI